MSADELDRWLASLGGRGVDGHSDEGAALRAQIRAQPAEAAAVATIDPAREAQLIALARAEGLLPAAGPPSPQGNPVTRSAARRWRPALLAAAFAGIAIGVATLQFTQVPTETFRGAVNGVVVLEARQPRDLKARLLRELQQAGVHASGYERLGRVGIDADLPQPVTAQVRRILEEHHIPVPDDGALVVEIYAPGAP